MTTRSGAKSLLWGLPIFFVLLAGFLIYVNVRENILERSLRENHALTSGTVVEIDERGVKKRDRITYHYTFEGKAYAAVRWLFVPEEWKSIVPGRPLPIAVDTTDPENSLLLLYRQDFEGFRLPYPDSLKYFVYPDER